jgi:hypothetical protein
MYEVFYGKARMFYSEIPLTQEEIQQRQAAGYTVKIDGKVAEVNGRRPVDKDSHRHIR